MQFSSDFIVGFPGETDHDFSLTLSLLEKVRYESIFSFMYSPRKHTKAFTAGDDISLEQKKQRLYRVQETQEQIQRENNHKKIGQVIRVLVTGKNPKKEGEVTGRTESYQVVNFKSNASTGQFSQVKIESVSPYSLRGKEI